MTALITERSDASVRSEACAPPGRARSRRGPRDPLTACAIRRWREEGRRGLGALVRLPTAGAPEPLDPALAHVAGWAARLGLRGLTLGVVGAPEGGSALVLDVAGDPRATSGAPVVVHAHLDPGGGAGALAALAAVAALQDADRPHPRCVLVLETPAARPAPALRPLLDPLRTRLAPPALVLSLDATPPDGDRLWLATSTRGRLALTLAVDLVDLLAAPLPAVLAGGVAPSPFRVARRLLDRVECAETGRVLVDALHVDLPGDARTQAADTAALLGGRLGPGARPGVRSTVGDLTELLLDTSWRPALAVVGADGLPGAAPATGDGHAGHGLAGIAPAGVALALSVHLPPTCDAVHAARVLVDRLQRDPPPGARVRCAVHAAIGGWRAVPHPGWLRAALGRAARAAFDAREATFGTAEAIVAARPLADAFPDAPLVVTGAARGDTLPDGERLAVALAHLLAVEGQ